MDLDDELYDELAIIFAEVGAAESVAFTLANLLEEELFDSIAGATREEILAIARDAGNLLAENITAGNIQTVADTLERGLRDQLGVDGIARELREVIDMTPGQAETWRKERDALIKAGGKSPEAIDKIMDKRRAELIKDRAEVMAQAEARNAIEAGELAVSKNRGDTHKVWITVSDDRVTDGCEENEQAGPIPIDAEYPSGDQHPPRSGNPRCRCSQAFVQDTGGGELGRAEDRAAEWSAQTAAAKA